MREIKFRAWHRGNKTMWNVIKLGMVLGSPISLLGDGNTEHRFESYNDQFELMQFTGLLSKKNQEVWEGDIIAFLCPHCSDLHIASIEWVEDLASWGFRDTEGQISPLALPVDENDLSQGIGLLAIEQVVGNIYQDAELLESTK